VTVTVIVIITTVVAEAGLTPAMADIHHLPAVAAAAVIDAAENVIKANNA
jgi:hypothetical protein